MPQELVGFLPRQEHGVAQAGGSVASGPPNALYCLSESQGVSCLGGNTEVGKSDQKPTIIIIIITVAVCQG